MESKTFTIWLTGLSGAGKSTIGKLLEQRIRRSSKPVELLDGDVVRAQLWPELGFSREDRLANISRLGYLCRVLTANGVSAVVAAISPYRQAREQERSRLVNFIEVYVTCSLGTLIARDVKGLYSRALSGDLQTFTGISDPYEPPQSPDVTVNSENETPEGSVERIWAALLDRELVPGHVPRATTESRISSTRRPNRISAENEAGFFPMAEADQLFRPASKA